MPDNTIRMGGQFSTAIIPSGTPVVITMNEAPLPCTVTLKSANAARLIEVSTDGGTEYFTPAVDMSSATQMALAINAPVSHVRVTGVANDTWRIQ